MRYLLAKDSSGALTLISLPFPFIISSILRTISIYSSHIGQLLTHKHSFSFLCYSYISPLSILSLQVFFYFQFLQPKWPQLRYSTIMFSTCTRPLHVFTPKTKTISAPVPYNPKQSTPHHLHGSFIRPKLNDTHSIRPRFTLFFVFSLQFPIFCSLCVCCFPDIGLYEDWKYWDVLVGE